MEYTLEDNVIRVLRSYEVSRVNFRLFGIDVRGTVYGEIADKILEGHFTVEIDSSLDKYTEAKYSRKKNKFRMSRNAYGFRGWHSAVVHEATHALTDWRKIQITKIDDEVVAHIAHTLYMRRAGFGFKSHGITDPVWYAARDVADSIIKSGKPNDALVKKLRDAVKNDPFYHEFIGEMADNDG